MPKTNSTKKNNKKNRTTFDPTTDSLIEKY